MGLIDAPEEPRDDEFAHLLSPVSLAVSLTRSHAKPYIARKHVVTINEALVRLHQRLPGEPRRLMIAMPPQEGKSLLVSHWFPTWAFALDPAVKILVCSYALHLAVTNAGRPVRNTIREFYPFIGTSLTDDTRAAWRWRTNAGGSLESHGVEGGITGLGYDIGIIDDPIKGYQQAQSPLVRESLWNWWQSEFLTRRSPNALIVVIATRWHEDDLSGRLLKEEPELWRSIVIPALAEAEDDPLGRRPGEWLQGAYAPSHYENIREKNPRVFNALYQQRPAAPEGAALHRSWWKWYTTRPDRTKFDQIIQTWDTTFKDAASNDFVAAWVLGRMGSDVYVLDGVHDHLNAPRTIQRIKSMRREWPEAKRILIEDSANGTAIIQLLQHEVTGITPVAVGGKSKEQRLHWETNSVAGFVEAGHVYLPKYDGSGETAQCVDPQLAQYAQGLVDEAASFPYAAHDDQLDAFVQGCQWLMPRVWGAERRAEKAAGEADPKTPLEQHRAWFRGIIQKRLKANFDQKIRDQRHGHMGRMPGW